MVLVNWKGVSSPGYHQQQELYFVDKGFRPEPYISPPPPPTRTEVRKNKAKGVAPLDPGNGWSDVRIGSYIQSQKMNVVAKVITIRIVHTGDRQTDRKQHNGSLDVAYHLGDELKWLLVTPDGWNHHQWRLLSPEEEKKYLEDLYQLNAEF
jgi:hypothetical protein